MTPTCPRCGGPTVALFYSVACERDCAAGGGPVWYAVREAYFNEVRFWSRLYRDRRYAEAAATSRSRPGVVLRVQAPEGAECHPDGCTPLPYFCKRDRLPESQLQAEYIALMLD